jgi:hypothetical protein
MVDNVTPLALVGIYKDSYPCASLYRDNIENETEMSPALIAALCISLFEAYMHLVPDNEQISFESCFKEAFDIMLNERHRYTSTFDVADDEF